MSYFRTFMDQVRRSNILYHICGTYHLNAAKSFQFSGAISTLLQFSLRLFLQNLLATIESYFDSHQVYSFCTLLDTGTYKSLLIFLALEFLKQLKIFSSTFSRRRFKTGVLNPIKFFQERSGAETVPIVFISEDVSATVTK